MSKGKKTLLITASTFPRFEGDTEPRFILDYAKAMQKYYDVTVLAPSFPGAALQEIMEGVNVIRYRYFFNSLETLCYPGAIVPRIKEKKIRAILIPFLFIGLYRSLHRISAEYDVIHAHWFIPQAIIHSFINKSFYITGHGGDVTSLNKGIMHRLKQRAIRKSSGIILVSQRLKDVFMDNYPEVDKDSIRIISMGCNTKSFSPVHREEQFFKQGEKQVVLFVGRLAEKKGVKYLIDAVKRIDNVELVIVGDGPLNHELKEQVTQLGISEKVQFLGAKPHEELKKIYASADIFCAPSVVAEDGDEEGLPCAVLEAMASGLPIVACDSGGIREVIHDEINGFVVEQKNSEALSCALKRLLADKTLRTAFIQRGHETAKEFDYDTIAARYYEVLNG